MTNRYICIHGHFYQPPRENAWLESIEAQDSAHPYHDWNMRITAECYAANAASRILDGEGYIIDIVNNYTRMSFNFGPTLLSWMVDHAPTVYQAVLHADKVTAGFFDGHGSALAQVYNHVILPLANRRDKVTQIRWGIRDFEYRFGRSPEGMWLPETAVDTETLDIMAQFGIKFTLLSPHQAQAVRYAGSGNWQDVGDGSIDTTRAYRADLPSGRSIALFFYNSALSHAVAFEQLPDNGDNFYERLLTGFNEYTDQPQLVHICSDGETYGHHHRHGDMGLAYTLYRITQSDSVRLTNYGAFLAAHPATDEVRIKGNTSWSCSHGVERWRSDCGCNSGSKPGWRQNWRGPLRQALDWLRDSLAPSYETLLGRYLKDPWKARDDYIDVILSRDSDTIEHFFRSHRRRAMSPSDRITVLKLLEMQRHSMLMYTSCGWFFDELSGIETVQILQYAGRALQLAESMFEETLEPTFLEKLALAPSNIRDHGNGRRIYEKWVRPAAVNLAEVGAHFAISSLFWDYQERNHLYSYTAARRAYEYWEAGRAKLALGRVEITSLVTWESADFTFAVLHFGDHNISCGLNLSADKTAYQAIRKEIVTAFEQADFQAVVQKIDRFCNSRLYSMKTLFRDEQRRILDSVVESRLTDAISLYRAVYEPNVPLMRFLKGTNSLTPRALSVAGELVLNHDLQEELGREHLNHDQIRELMNQARLARIPLDDATLEYTLRRNIEHHNQQFEADPTRYDVLDDLAAAVELVYNLPFHVVLRGVQNTHFNVGRRLRGHYLERAADQEAEAARWIERFDQLGEKLLIRPWEGPVSEAS